MRGGTMPICEKCNKTFPNWIKIDGVNHNLHKRKYCFECSPFRGHNTKVLVPKEKVYKCSKCGDTNKENFYKRKRTICKNCKNKETALLSKEKRNFAVNYLGGKCTHCGFNKYKCSLDIHHINPKMKDKNFTSMRHWSYERIKKELKNCILLCKNCHSAYHSGEWQ